MKKIHLVFSKIIFFAILGLCSQQSNGQPLNSNAIRPTKTYFIKSAFNNKTYQLNVSLPKSYSEQDSLRYPVLYALDGKFSFNSICSIRDLFDLGKEIKEIIIVSIDDSCNSNEDWLASRYNDFTPSAMLQSDTVLSRILNIPEGKMKSGGAEKFLNTLENQMIPFMDSHYKTNTDRGLFGHSLGGLFAGYCLFNKPWLFKRYGINSPSFWWNGSEMVRNENAYASRNTELTADVFFSVGGAEDPIMLSSFHAFTNAIKNHNYKNLMMTVKIFEDESHLSVVPACSSRTLKVLYGAGFK